MQRTAGGRYPRMQHREDSQPAAVHGSYISQIEDDVTVLGQEFLNPLGQRRRLFPIDDAPAAAQHYHVSNPVLLHLQRIAILLRTSYMRR